MKNKDTNNQIITDCYIHPSAMIFHFVNLYNCTIGKDSMIGSFVEIQKGASVGERVKVSSHSFVCEGVIIEDEVFIGHHVVFTNDKYPKATNPDGTQKRDADWNMQKTVVERGASIGSNSTILPGVVIGRNSLVGAGSVVTKDVPPNTIVAGNPARLLRIKENASNT